MWQAILLSVVLLGGCASPPSLPRMVVRPDHAELSSFSLSGRISVKHDSQRSSAGMRWRHDAGMQDEIFLLAPLGQTVARISRNSGGVELDTSDGKYFADDTEQLTRQMLGWGLPLDGLLYWALALPNPGSTADIRRDSHGRVESLSQDGWTIAYTQYATSAVDSLPLRVHMQRADMVIDLLIDSWEKQ